MPILKESDFEIITRSPEQTIAVGRRLGELLRPGDVVCLQGALGTGKTCLTKGIGAGLKVVGKIVSPTFVYINEYGPEGPGSYLYHVDLYRVEDPSSLYNLGLDDYIYGDGVTVIEWAERAQELLPAKRLWVAIRDLGGQRRCFVFTGMGVHYKATVAALQRAIAPDRPPKGQEA
ncbi:MAG: tRNA (adenosine(37)-N6)-threonylcarbamoyltransferase complex ATPase subunit type 1 TsaE [Anaerolineae bacterium]|nr:tRNA (adenosine(37)-N6)-threonylcarbamoyltransferase complex ATPase subunit type 1 TsaE [Anaerolineae bacterium]